MKKMICALALLFGMFSQTNSTNYNGTTGVIFVSYDQPFSNAATHTMTGFVRFEKGCTVLNYSSSTAEIVWDACVPFAGGLDLRDTNSISLVRSLICDTNFTLSSGGNIYGNGNSIVLSGNLMIPAGKIIHIGNDTIIDGNGYKLTVESWAQIFVDTNRTLTLRNLILRNGNHSLSFPPIRLASFGSKLALSNVEIAATGDFLFPQGQLFVHDDVVFTGTSAFIYWSTQQSFITPNATLCFDSGTTFSVAPSTLSADRFDKTRTATINNFINLVDPSSQLIFNNCSLKTTLTGCRLRSGNILFDNKVNLDSRASKSIYITTVTQVGGDVTVGGSPIFVSWSPDGRFIAVANYVTSGTLQIFSFDGSSSITLVGSSVSTGNNPVCVSWSPDGRFIAVCNYVSNTLQVYSFNGSSTPTQVGSNVATGAASAPICASWSPDGKFIAIVTRTSSTLQVYSFNGVSTPTQIGTNLTTGTNPSSVSWSLDGKFIAVVNYTSKTLQVYSFNGSATPTTVGGTAATGTSTYNLSWSPDGRFIAVANLGSASLQVFLFNGSGTPTQVGGDATTQTNPCSTSWSPDGRFIAVVNQTFLTLEIFLFNGSSTPVKVGNSVTAENYPTSVSWSPNGSFIAIVNSTLNTLQVYRVNYIVDRSVQAIANSFVFGNSALGSGYDANINLLSAANLDLNSDCKVLIDNVNN